MGEFFIFYEDKSKSESQFSNFHNQENLENNTK